MGAVFSVAAIATNIVVYQSDKQHTGFSISPWMHHQSFTHFQDNQSIFTAISFYCLHLFNTLGYIPPHPLFPPTPTPYPYLPTYHTCQSHEWLQHTSQDVLPVTCSLFLVPASFIWRFFGHFCFRTFVFGLIFVPLTPTPSPLPWWTHYHFSWPSSDFLIKFLNLLHFTLCVLHLCP